VGEGRWPLTGRDEELRWAGSVLDQPGTVVIVGPAGVGKSRLAGAIAEAAASNHGGVVRRVVATETTAQVPLGAFFALLWDDAAADERIDGWTVAEAAPRVVPADTDVVLVVDDAHLLDVDSAVLVHQLVASGRTRVVVTVRRGEPTLDAITSIWKDLGGERLDLEPLSEADTARLAAEGLGAPLVPHTATALFEITQGNPLYVRELIREGLADGHLVRRRDVWTWDGSPTPGRRLGELVSDRIGRLAPVEVDAARFVAFGEPIRHEVVAAAVGAATLVELEERGLVAVVGNEHEIEIAHPLQREVIRRSTGPTEALAVHDRLLDVAGPSATPIRRVLWWLRSTRDRPLDGAVVLSAAQQSRRQSTPALTLELLGALPDDHRDDPRARLARGEALYDVYRMSEAIPELAAAFALATSDRLRSEAAALQVAALMVGEKDLAGADEVLAAAEARIDEPDELDYVRARYVAHVAMAGRHPDPALRDRLAEHPNPRIRVTVGPAMGVADVASAAVGNLSSAQVDSDDVAAVADEMPQLADEHVFRVMYGKLGAGEFDEVERLIADVRASGIVAPDQLAHADLLEARVMVNRGRARTALASASRCLVVMEAVMPNDTRVTWALSMQAIAAAWVGDHDLASSACAQAEARDIWEAVVIAYDSARLLAQVTAADDPTGAARKLVEVADRAAAEGMLFFELGCLYDAACLRSQPAVERRIAELVPQGTEGWFSAQLQHLEGRRAGEGEVIEIAASRFERGGSLPFAIAALVDAEAAYRAVRQTRAADRARAHALRLAEQCEGARFAWLTDVPRRTELTTREHEIAALAASGLTSNEIAAQLVVSRRTVDNALSRVYVKLGIAGRHELPDALR
jgi:DNA-binding CsgD family transcriptional regulator